MTRIILGTGRIAEHIFVAKFLLEICLTRNTRLSLIHHIENIYGVCRMCIIKVGSSRHRIQNPENSKFLLFLRAVEEAKSRAVFFTIPMYIFIFSVTAYSTALLETLPSATIVTLMWAKI
jgi:hypothetical protein